MHIAFTHSKLFISVQFNENVFSMLSHRKQNINLIPVFFSLFELLDGAILCFVLHKKLAQVNHVRSHETSHVKKEALCYIREVGDQKEMMVMETNFASFVISSKDIISSSFRASE